MTRHNNLSGHVVGQARSYRENFADTGASNSGSAAAKGSL
jgi:hypothetical protein